MALQLVTGIMCAQDTDAVILSQFLERETRPLFEDEVDPNYKTEYNLVRKLEYPDTIEIAGNELWVQWMDNDEVKNVDFEKVVDLFQSNRFDLIAAHETPADALSWDEDVYNGWYWIQINGIIQQVSKEVLETNAPRAVEVLSRYWDV